MTVVAAAVEPTSWARELPPNWEWVKLNRVARLGTGHTPDRTQPHYWENCTIPWVTAADLSKRSNAFAPLMDTEQHISELGLANSAAVLHPAGTVMFCRTASVGLFCQIGCPMATTQAFVTWTPGPRLDGRYLLYTIAAMRPEFDRLAYGSTHLTIYMPDLEALRIPLPPVEEQRRIADFLDDQVARIDTLANLRRERVNLIGELGRSTISTQVTGSVNRSALRDSLGWLARMSPRWEIIHPKAVFRERSERSRADDIHLTPSQTYGVLPQAEYMAITGNRVVLNLTGQDNMKHVEPNDFVIHLRSFQGGIEYSTLAGKVSNAYTVLTPAPNIEPRFYKWVLKSSGYIQELNASTNQLRDGQSIKFADFAAIDLPLPPLEEQRRIADFLDEFAESLKLWIDLEEQGIALLEERKRALITAAVTGELDVTTARPIGMGKWVPNVGASVEAPAAAQSSGIGGIG